MTRLLPALVALVLAAPLAAQRPEIRASAGIAFAGYREQSQVLDFRGSGPAARVDVRWRRFGLTAAQLGNG